MITANGTKERIGGDNKSEQRRRILEFMDRHVATCQNEGNVGKLTVELEFMRGGNIKSPYVEYRATWRFLDKIEGLG